MLVIMLMDSSQNVNSGNRNKYAVSEMKDI